MCDIYKCGTARKQFGLDSTIWALQEDRDAKYMRKVALNWQVSHGIEKLDWPSMSSDLVSIENIWQLLKMTLRKEEIRNCQSQ